MAGCTAALSQNCEDVFLSNLDLAANRLGNAGIIASIEPINPIDMPSNFVTKLDQEFEIIKKVGTANLKLQFDFYHRAMVGKGIVGGPLKSARHLGKIKIGGMPGRNNQTDARLIIPRSFKNLTI